MFGGLLARLMEGVAFKWGPEEALDELVLAALEHTRSRNVLIARMNDELGVIEVRNGAGRDWEETGDSAGLRLRLSREEGGGIVPYVAVTGKAFVTGDVDQEPLYRKLFERSKSEIAVPIRDRHGRVRGVLNVESDVADNYTADDVQLCMALGSLASMVLEREEMSRREEALIQIGSSLDRAMNDDELVQQVLKVAGEVLRFQSCSIFLFDTTTGKFMLRGSVGQLRDKVGSVGYRAGEGCTGWVCESGEPIRTGDPQKDPRWAGRILEFPGEQIAAYLAVPVVYRGRSIGAIRVVRRQSENPYQDNRFTEDDERLLSTIAEQVAIGLENVRSLQKQLGVERMAAWGELSAKSSHMIGNRVFAIRGDVNELGHLLADPRPRHDKLLALQQSLLTNVQRIEEILQDFRDFVMATQLSTARAELNFVVREAVQEVFPRRSKVRVEYDLAEGLPEVVIDVRKIRRAITELVENALSFFEQGALRVKTGRASAAAVRRARLARSKEYLAIEIEDQGPGIKQEHKARIFEPFFTTRVKGMGLGLSIVKGILDAHGGAVLEQGAEGKGARFLLLIPVPERSPA
jgi:signal transduction histidine kinase